MKPQTKSPPETVHESGDPLIDEIRRVRHEISARFDHDPQKLVAYYMELQEQHRERLLSPPEAEEPGQPAA